MDKKIEGAYKRKCFQGRGSVARWMDRVFFSVLSGFCLLLVVGNGTFSFMLSAVVFALYILLDRKRWDRFKRDLWRSTVLQLKREAWLNAEAERIRQEGGVLLFPTPDKEAMMGHCLQQGRGSRLHCIGENREGLSKIAVRFGCTMTTHPWGEGTEPTYEQVKERIKEDAPRQKTKIWGKLLKAPGNRYLLTGCVLLVLSLFLKRALYWRLLGSLCLFIGTIHRSIRMMTET